MCDDHHQLLKERGGEREREGGRERGSEGGREREREGGREGSKKIWEKTST